MHEINSGVFCKTGEDRYIKEPVRNARLSGSNACPPLWPTRVVMHLLGT